jgi:hypothetical protein
LDGQGLVRLPKGVFRISHLELNSGQRLIMSPGTVLKPLTTPLQANQLMIMANGVDDIVIEGGVVDGAGSVRSTGIGLTGVVRGRVLGTRCINMSQEAGARGDGLYINKSLPGDRCNRPAGRLCEDIVIEDVIADNNQRQGMMVASVRGLRIRNSSFLNSSTDLTGAGIDFEPNDDSDIIEDVEIDGCTFAGNEHGILFQPSGTEASVDVTVRNSNFLANRARGLSITRPDSGMSDRCSVLVKGNHIRGNGGQGVNLSHNRGGVRIVDNVIEENGSSGVLIDFAHRWIVSGNTLRRNGERGLAVTTRPGSVGEFGQIVENQVWDNAQAPHLVNGGPGIVISAQGVEPHVLVAHNIYGSTTTPARQTVGLETQGPHSSVTVVGNRAFGIIEKRHVA